MRRAAQFGKTLLEGTRNQALVGMPAPKSLPEFLLTDKPIDSMGIEEFGTATNLLASLAVEFLRGNPEATDALEYLASSSATMAGQAQALIVNQNVLIELMKLKDPQEFGKQVMDFFNDVLKKIAHMLPNGKRGKIESIWYSQVMALGPFKVMSLIFDEAFEPSDVVRTINHDVLNRNIAILDALSNASDTVQLKILARNVNFDKRTLNVRDRLLQAILPLLVLASKAGIAIYVDVPEHIQFKEGLDIMQIELTLANLVDNAVKYHYGPEKAGRYIKIRLDADAGALITQDNGKGIADPVGVWGNHHREADRHPGVDGKGIGLASVKERLQSIGWEIELESEVGAGSKFTIYPKSGDIIERADHQSYDKPLNDKKGGGGNGGNSTPMGSAGGMTPVSSGPDISQAAPAVTDFETLGDQPTKNTSNIYRDAISARSKNAIYRQSNTLLFRSQNASRVGGQILIQSQTPPRMPFIVR